MVAKDFAGTMKTMAGMGYEYTEMCYPKGLCENAGFAPLMRMQNLPDLKRMIEEMPAGLKCPESCHFGMADLKINFH